MSTTKKLCICAICIAMCYVIPAALHPFGLGPALSPLHLPILVCGIICGPIHGLACSVIGPMLSTLLTGMPSTYLLPTMLPELIAYGMLGGYLFRRIKVKSLVLKVYLTLFPTMFFGRLIGALSKAAFYLLGMFGVQAFSFSQVVTAYFVTTLPAIVLQLIIVPLLIATLKEEKLIKIR